MDQLSRLLGGAEALAALCEQRNGQRLYIPMSATDVLASDRAPPAMTREMAGDLASAATAFNARRFLADLLDGMAVSSIQVDGGSEFMAEFEDACKRLGISLAVLPPRRPQLNGCVERASRTVRIEFRNRYVGDMTVADANAELVGYLDYYNGHRPHSSIGMMTPSAHFDTLREAA